MRAAAFNSEHAFLLAEGEEAFPIELSDSVFAFFIKFFYTIRIIF